MKHLILGIIQGLTEFLPVSSSGHLVIFTKLFGLETDLFFDALVHVATLLAVVIYFWKDIFAMAAGFISGSWQVLITRNFRKVYNESIQFKLACLIMVATFATGVIGVSFQDYFEGWFDSISAVGWFLLLTGALLFLADRFGQGNRKENDFTRVDALVIGAAQGAAIAPGFSRSGATISMALLRDLDKNLAARFSFILSIPAILGAVILQGKDLAGGTAFSFSYLLGFIAAFITGYLAIKIFIDLLQKAKLRYFAYYCFVVGLLVLGWAFFAV